MSSFVASDFFPPGSLLCPPVNKDAAYGPQLLPIDCNGVMLLSRWTLNKETHRFYQLPQKWLNG